MKRIPCVLAAMSLALTSCAVTEPPHYAADHPANPEAPFAAAEPPPSALTTYRSFEGAHPAQQPTPEDGHAHRH